MKEIIKTTGIKLGPRSIFWNSSGLRINLKEWNFFILLVYHDGIFKEKPEHDGRVINMVSSRKMLTLFVWDAIQ
jgi:hypothetical protein